ncbi:MEP-1 [Carabus blaptoides fortunei]
MESPITMGEAEEKSKHQNSDDVCVNGEQAMDMCSTEDDFSVKHCDKVPTHKVPSDECITDNEELMEVNVSSPEADEDLVDDDSECKQPADELEDTIDDEEDVKIVEQHNEPPAEISDDDDELMEQCVTDKMVNGTDENSRNSTTIDLVHSPLKLPVKDDSELNDSGDVVLVGENGNASCSSPDVEEVLSVSDTTKTTSPPAAGDGTPGSAANSSSEIVNLVSPVKKKLKKTSLECTPRRSTRNLNKQKSYVEKEEDPDVEEVPPTDPLADPLRDDKENSANKTVKSVVKQPVPSLGSTIVVSDTKRLVEIAANSKVINSSGKKEPTLVIIDTNSILSGRGPVPVTHKASPLATSFSMMPVALPAQGVYPPNMRATITPIPMNTTSKAPATASAAASANITASSPAAAVATTILPTLTDDMYVVEAPSFIVPYVYEKPPLKPFREFVIQMQKDIEEQKKKLKRQQAEEEEAGETEDKEVAVDGKATDDSTTDTDEQKTTSSDKKDDVVIIPNVDDVKTIDLDDIPDETPKPKSNSYFDNALGQFFINIGNGLVQEFVQTDLLKQQKRKQNREGGNPETKQVITSLIKNLEYSKENNEPYRMEQKRCEFCSFRTESDLVLAHHLETPHMRTYVYKCNFCPLEVRSPHDILFHMEAEHNTRGRLERAPAFHQCPNCPFEDNQKGKLSRHLVTCVKKFKPERNLEPPADWEPPAKIPRVPRIKQQGLSATAATYQALAQAKGNYQLFSKLQQATAVAAGSQAFSRGRGRPSLMGKVNSTVRPQTPIIRTNMMYRPGTSGNSVLVPTAYQFSGNQIFQNSSGTKSSAGKVVQQPSISITPLPRQPASSSSAANNKSSTSSSATEPSSKATFVICEICDGYIKDLEQLRNHMQWIHKVKIHPKMIYNRPPLNCQKCQFRFFTDQGLERHLLGSHGLVTSSMQEAANKSKDAGRCPVCGRVYQWKLLNHVARDHNMTLKPAHLSYKCTVCTATFGMYKQFENHVYSAHSVVAKRVMDKKSSSSTSSAAAAAAGSSAAGGGASSRNSTSSDSLLKPLKINDEITIIPQPAKTKSSNSTSSSARSSTATDRGK